MRPLKEIISDHLGRRRVRDRSYAQSGEDRIAAFVLNEMKIWQPTYLDLGAHDPVWLSNTYYFYRRGGRGVCVEADPELCRRIARKRRRDKCLNVAVAPQAGKAQFHVMDAPTLSTLSEDEVREYGVIGRRVAKTIEVDTVTPMAIVEQHFGDAPHLVSLDVEGMDLDVIQSWDFDRARPEVFIIETVSYAEDGSEEKIPEIAQELTSLGYFAYADTFINTVFVDREAYLRGRRGLPARARMTT